MNKFYSVRIPDIEYYRSEIKCQYVCPVSTKAGRYVQQIAKQDFEQAYWLARENNPFVYTCGRICAHPCETSCRRSVIDEPISIRALKRASTDHHNLGLGHGGVFKPSKRKNKIAIIGAGPAGLSCSHDLARMGYTPTIFEASNVIGGMLSLGIPVYRLPRDILKMEIDNILNLGIELKLNSKAGKDFMLQDLLNQGYEAIFIGTGAQMSKELSLPGIELNGVLKGIEFLLNVNLGYKVDVGDTVVVIGGGNVAIDVARSIVHGYERQFEDGSTTIDAARWALRLGAKEVRVVCLESRAEMPAFEYEVEEAEKEGILIYPSRGPKRILGDSGKVIGLEVISCLSIFDAEGKFNPTFMPDTEEIISAETVILAIGQKIDISFIQKSDEIKITKYGTIEVDPETLQTSRKEVFSGGDVAFGPRIIIEAIADGQRSAMSIHNYLTGRSLSSRTTEVAWKNNINFRPVQNYDIISRQDVPTLSLEKRIGISEVELGYDSDIAIKEANRCLKCQINTIFDSSKCILCGGCVDICPYNCFRIVSLNNVVFKDELESIKYFNYLTYCAVIKDSENCIRCGLCAQRCPAGAITMETFEEVGNITYETE